MGTVNLEDLGHDGRGGAPSVGWGLGPRYV